MKKSDLVIYIIFCLMIIIILLLLPLKINASNLPENKFYISYGLDNKHFYKGYVNSRVRILYSKHKIEPYLLYEDFKHIKKFFLGCGINYKLIDKKFELTLGPEFTNVIHYKPHYKEKGFCIGLSNEFRYNFNKNIFYSLEFNVKTEPTISKKYVFSTYSSIVFRLKNTHNFF